MKKERMKILQLLAEEVIDTDEAVRLLKALNHEVIIKKDSDCENTWENICKLLEMIEEEVISANKAAKLIKSMKTSTDMEDEEQDLMRLILMMTEDGEIDADEAAELLKALEFFNDSQGDSDEKNVDENVQQFAGNSEGFAEDFSERLTEDFSERLAEDFSERFAEDFSERFHAAFKNVEPELDAAAKEVLGAVASLLDDVSQSLKGKNNEPDEKNTHGGDIGG